MAEVCQLNPNHPLFHNVPLLLWTPILQTVSVSVFIPCMEASKKWTRTKTCTYLEQSTTRNAHCTDITWQHQIFELSTRGSVRMDLKFDAAHAHTINVIVYAEHENVIQCWQRAAGLLKLK